MQPYRLLRMYVNVSSRPDSYEHPLLAVEIGLARLAKSNHFEHNEMTPSPRGIMLLREADSKYE